MNKQRLQEIKQRCEAATKGPWKLCFHLQSEENDMKCPCGFQGDIWGSDGEHVVCSIGVPHVDESSEMVPRYERHVEIANAHLIASASQDIQDLLAHIEQLQALADLNSEKIRLFESLVSDADTIINEDSVFSTRYFWAKAKAEVMGE